MQTVTTTAIVPVKFYAEHKGYMQTIMQDARLAVINQQHAEELRKTRTADAEKFIQAATEAEIERKPVKPAGKAQQVAAVGKEVVASLKATTSREQYALAKFEVKFEESESGAKLWFENTHLLDDFNDISWRRIKKTKATEILAKFGMTVEDYVAEYEHELEEARERNRIEFERRNCNHKIRPARVNPFTPKPDTASAHKEILLPTFEIGKEYQFTLDACGNFAELFYKYFDRNSCYFRLAGFNVSKDKFTIDCDSDLTLHKDDNGEYVIIGAVGDYQRRGVKAPCFSCGDETAQIILEQNKTFLYNSSDL